MTTSHTSERLLLLRENDNILVAKSTIAAGEKIQIMGQRITTSKPLELGHKVARQAIRTGEKVIKYGAPIGVATTDINVGDHVHINNMRSDYTPTYSLEGVDDDA